MSLPLRWHDDVPADLREVRELLGQAAFPEGAIAITDRGSCAFAVKAANA